MTSPQDVLNHCADLLETDSYSDYCPIGLQVAGTRTTVKIIATAVSSTLETFQQAAAIDADMLLVHHGPFWKNTPQVIDATTRERLRVLFDSGITLASYHLPLDGNDQIGNNAVILRELQLHDTGERFAHAGGNNIGFIGTSDQPILLRDLVDQITQLTGSREPLVLGEDHDLAQQNHTVSRIAICSGGGAAYVTEAANLGCDVLITGEPREETHALATELGVSFVAAGHYATETFGIRELGRRLAENFDIEHRFIAVHNPV